MKENYQWMFSKDEIGYFSAEALNSDWIINKQDFNTVRNTPQNLSLKGIKINSSDNKDYICMSKDKKYMELAYFYIKQKNYKNAKEALTKAMEFNPAGRDVGDALGYIHRLEDKDWEAKEALKKLSE